MILCALILVGILMHFEFVKCHEIFEILPSIMVEFRFNQFITIDNKLGWNDMNNVVKNLNHQGYFIGFSQKQSDKYQSRLIFTNNLTQFQWTNPTYAPILVVFKMQTEADLKEVDVSIGSEVLFLDWYSFKVYESYSINKIKIRRYLGQLQTYNTSKESSRFFPSEDFIPNMENRRGNFFGMQLTGGIAGMKGDPKDYLNLVKFIPEKDAYDVTNIVGNPKYARILDDFVERMILKLMENKFNFTSKLLLRRDQKIGSPRISSNHTAIIDQEGIFQDLVGGSIEFACASFSMLPTRLKFVDFLPPTWSDHDTIFIPIKDSSEEIDWNTFIDPFAMEIWIAIVIKCIIFTTLVSIIEWFHDCKMVRT